MFSTARRSDPFVVPGLSCGELLADAMERPIRMILSHAGWMKNTMWDLVVSLFNLLPPAFRLEPIPRRERTCIPQWSRRSRQVLNFTWAWQLYGDASPPGSSFGCAPDLTVLTVETGTCFKRPSGAFEQMVHFSVQSGAISMDIPRPLHSGPSVDGHTRTCTGEEHFV